jgi:hypothetical protein
MKPPMLTSTLERESMGNLSKTRFCTGLQCVKQLWWRLHEPDAPELVASPSLQSVFDTGHRVGELAQAEFPGGQLIVHEHGEIAAKVADTAAALKGEAPAIFEASFLAEGVFVAVDVLERHRQGHTLVEVKSTLDVKDAHIPDVAIQLHVLRAAGLDVPRAHLMHLDRTCRHPDLSKLFRRQDVTRQAEAFLPAVPGHLRRMRKALAGDLPAIEPGPHCAKPYPCPFASRCMPEVPDDHVSTLYKGGRRALALLDDGIESIHDIPDDAELPAIAARQARAVKAGNVVVEPGLAGTLEKLAFPIAFLDFETVMPAIPVWSGCGPYTQVPVQVSCHVVDARGAVIHYEYLAEGDDDPRPAMAEAVVEACGGARSVVAYNAGFEKRCIEHLAEAVPGRRTELLAIAARLVDLLRIVRRYVYHPAFRGEFGMKVVGPALVKGLAYDELAIGDGATAAAVLQELLLGGDDMIGAERETLRTQLLAYCAQDTIAMVKVVERLRELASPKEEMTMPANETLDKPLPDDVRRFVESTSWRFAKTYAATWPHEYVVRTPENTTMLVALSRHVFEYGTDGRFYSQIRKYHHEGGKVYWSMDPTPEATTLINRCDEAQTYEARLAAGTLPLAATSKE